MLLPVHIVAGGLAIVLGGVALLAPKGGTVHRSGGLLFVYAMLTMGISGSVLALRQSLTNANVLGGFMSAYFVVTALTAVRPPSPWTRGLNAAALLVAIGLAAVEITLGSRRSATREERSTAFPFSCCFFSPRSPHSPPLVISG